MLNPNDYSAIIFDLGGVIINLDYNATVREFKNLGITNFDAVFSKARQADLADKFERGEISSDDFFAEITRLSELNLSRHELEKAWNAMLLDIPKGRLDLIQKIGQTRPVFLLSNTNHAHTQAYNQTIKANFGAENLDPWFSKVYLSFEMGKRKPEARIFTQVIEENNLNPATTLFIDDSPQHVEGARKVGLQAHHLTDEQDIRTLFVL